MGRQLLPDRTKRSEKTQPAKPSVMKHIHFIGIGGAGMSGLAEIAIARGIAVSGSDISDSPKIKALKKLGAKIGIGHRASNIGASVDLVVYTSAVARAKNPEIEAAKERGVRCVRRAEFLGELTRDLKTIAIAGTHGKTTTTAMIAHILIQAGLDPLVSVGATVHELGGKNARPGSGSLAVVEADEYDRSFLALTPFVAVLTTLEEEHLDIYRDLNDLQDAFVGFANAGSPHGAVLVNIDEPALRALLPRLSKKIVTFGVSSEEAKYRASVTRSEGSRTWSDIVRANERIGTLELVIPGEYNVKNALAAIAVAESLAIPFEIARDALATFRGAERRAQTIGEVNGVLVIDDYAHHPTEIAATLKALREGYPARRIVAIFQPHTFSRTRDFATDFGAVLAHFADVLYLADIYPAREEPIAGVSSELIVNAAKLEGAKKIEYIRDLDSLADLVARTATKGDIIVTIGAGTITEQAPKIVQALKQITPVSTVRTKQTAAAVGL